MNRTIQAEQANLRKMTADIVAAYLSNNRVDGQTLTGLIRSVHDALTKADSPPPAPAPTPAVPISKSIGSDYIVCLEDGKKLKMLKRHLMNSYGMTPEDYREKWGLPNSYPMTAPNYSRRRSTIAKESGLGRTH